MKRRAFLATALATAVTRPAFAVPFRLPQVEYAAERYVRQGERWQNMTVRYAPGMERLELQGAEAGGNIVLLRHDLGKAWLAMPRMRALAELPPAVLGRMNQIFDGTDIKPAGNETVNGIPCTRHTATGVFRGTVWLSRAGIPVKIDGDRQADGGRRRVYVEQSGIAPGPQAASLFEPPAGMMRLQMTDPSWMQFLDEVIG